MRSVFGSVSSPDLTRYDGWAYGLFAAPVCSFVGDFPRLLPRRQRRNSAPRLPSPKPALKNSRPSTTLFLGACPWPRPKKDKRWLKLSTERKHLTNVLKMVAYHMESDLLELIRPHYKRVEEEGRTFIQAALACYSDPYLTENWSGSNKGHRFMRCL